MSKWPWSPGCYFFSLSAFNGPSPCLQAQMKHVECYFIWTELYPNDNWMTIQLKMCAGSPCHLGEATGASGCPYGGSRQTGSRASAPPPLNLQVHLTRPGSHSICKSILSICFNLLGEWDGWDLMHQRHCNFNIFYLPSRPFITKSPFIIMNLVYTVVSRKCVWVASSVLKDVLTFCYSVIFFMWQTQADRDLQRLKRL